MPPPLILGKTPKDALSNVAALVGGVGACMVIVSGLDIGPKRLGAYGQALSGCSVVIIGLLTGKKPNHLGESQSEESESP